MRHARVWRNDVARCAVRAGLGGSVRHVATQLVLSQSGRVIAWLKYSDGRIRARVLETGAEPGYEPHCQPLTGWIHHEPVTLEAEAEARA